MTGKPFTDITLGLHRNDKVKTISDKQNSINIRGQNTVVNPHLFFNRISCVLKSSSDLEEFLYYELAPQPPSLFSNGVMRKPNKSSLGTLIKSFAPGQQDLPENCQYVVDGGHLLQSVVWPQPSTYRDVSLCYVSYVLKHYGPGTTVVFDGYSTISPKTAEQQRRAQRVTSSDIVFDENMATTTSQAAFLSNSHNKERFIDVVHQKMLTAGIVVKQADADADSLIVSTALALAGSSKPVVVVSTDTDILVMLVTQVVLNMDLHMLCQKMR